MQNPPKPPQKKNTRPGFLEIDTPIETIGAAPDHYIPPPRTNPNLQPGPFGRGVSTY